ncbi:MAG: DegV family protein [Anaerolineaceae bacterium]|nr:DegV family protein [Anaerolineaceae bacterium]
MSIQIVSDSTCDLPDEIVNSYPITIIPLYINIDGKSYLDCIELSRQEFYKRLPLANPHPTTSAPSPSQFKEVYKKLANQGASAIFSIHISSSLSAVFNSAKLAAKEFNDIPVFVIDSGNLTMAEGLIVLKAAQAAKGNKSIEEIKQLIENIIPNTYAYAKLDTLDYLLRGGRMSSIQHSIASLLKIKPLLRMNNGISKMEIARTIKRAFDKVVSIGLQYAPEAEFIGITHADAEEQVEELITRLKSACPNCVDPLINVVTPSLGSHVGPGALCISWIDRKEHHESDKKGLPKWFF